MRTPSSILLLLLLPVAATGFLQSPTVLPQTPRLRSPSACTHIAMSMEETPKFSRRDVGKVLGLLPFAAAGLSSLLSKPKLAQAGGLLPMEQSMADIFDKTVPSVCFISTEYTSMAQAANMDSANLPKGVGSGFIWDKEGHIVTNFHVINKVDNAIVSLTAVDGTVTKYKAKLTGVDPDKDIAVLKIDADQKSLLPIAIGTSDNLKVGQFALAIGNPFGQDHTLTTGVISGKNREITAPTGRQIRGVIQTDAAINPGNSGGPLLDSAGKVVGMNTASLGSGVNAGVSFAIPIDTVKGIVEQLIKFGQVSRAVLGVSYLQRLPTAAESERSGLPRVDKGVVVLEVPANSPCDKAGMIAAKRSDDPKVKPVIGDVIVAINEFEINNPQDLAPVMEKFKPGDKVAIKVKRGPEQVDKVLTVTLGAFKGNAFSKIESERPLQDGPDDGIPAMNVPLQNIAPQITPKLPEAPGY